MSVRTFVREPSPGRIVGSCGAVVGFIVSAALSDALSSPGNFGFLAGVFALVAAGCLFGVIGVFYSLVTQGPRIFTRLRLKGPGQAELDFGAKS
jgi:hypothetical protein